jgi:hypothetical protein
MNWQKKQSKFTYSGSPVTRTTYTCHTPLGTFSVFEAVSGRTFFKHPFFKTNWGDPFNEINPAPQTPCENLKDGLNKCEEIWSKAKHQINQH